MRKTLKNSLQPVNNAFKKRRNGKPVMVIKVHKYGEDDNRYDDESFKKVCEQDQQAGYYEQNDPTDMEGAELLIVLINIIKQRMCAALVNMPRI